MDPRVEIVNAIIADLQETFHRLEALCRVEREEGFEATVSSGHYRVKSFTEGTDVIEDTLVRKRQVARGREDRPVVGGGSHLGKHQAGFDLTDFLKLAPHGEDRVYRLPVVGELLASARPGRKPPHLKAFHFMTFLNLFLVLAVLLIIAVWRWWWAPCGMPSPGN